jgi:hypothetical protein
LASGIEFEVGSIAIFFSAYIFIRKVSIDKYYVGISDSLSSTEMKLKKMRQNINNPKTTAVNMSKRLAA